MVWAIIRVYSDESFNQIVTRYNIGHDEEKHLLFGGYREYFVIYNIYVGHYCSW